MSPRQEATAAPAAPAAATTPVSKPAERGQVGLDLESECSTPKTESAESECSTGTGGASTRSEMTKWDCSTHTGGASATSGADTCTTGAIGTGSSTCRSAGSPSRKPGLGSTSDNVVMFFDWDDTLLPTGHIHANPAYGVLVGGALRSHARLVEETLRVARGAGRVCIVTLSARPWVMESARKFLPGIDLPAVLLELDIPVFHADEHAGVPGCLPADVRCVEASDCMTLKANAMADHLNELYASHVLDRTKGMNVISVGDAEHEAAALKEVMREWGRSSIFPCAPLCKTLKLMTSPTLHQLSSELVRLPKLLQRLTPLPRDIDLCIAGPEDFDTAIGLL